MNINNSAIRLPLLRILLVVLFLPLLLFSLNFFLIQPAFAAIRQQEEAPGQILYQSRHRLQDTAHHSWQLVLFKRVKNEQVQEISLRMVGFPGEIEFYHPQPLTLIEQSGQTWQAKDLFAQQSPATNVGQYDLQPILSQLSPNTAATLDLNLKNPKNIQLKVPAAIILEWQTVAQTT